MKHQGIPLHKHAFCPKDKDQQMEPIQPDGYLWVNLYSTYYAMVYELRAFFASAEENKSH